MQSLKRKSEPLLIKLHAVLVDSFTCKETNYKLCLHCAVLTREIKMVCVTAANIHGYVKKETNKTKTTIKRSAQDSFRVVYLAFFAVFN